MDTQNSTPHDADTDEHHAYGRWRSDSETVERRDRELGDRMTDRELADVVGQASESAAPRDEGSTRNGKLDDDSISGGEASKENT